MQRYRVSFEDTFCRDVEVEAETPDEAAQKALGAHWDEQDWCDGHKLEVVGTTELMEDE